MPREIFPSSYECDCGHVSDFSENTVREMKTMSHRKKVCLVDSEPDQHAVVFDNGEMIDVICPYKAPNSPRKLPYTQKQGQYLAFIHQYTQLHGRPPSEWEMQQYFRVTPPAVHQMILTLEKRKLIERTPRQARTIRLLLPKKQIPALYDRSALRITRLGSNELYIDLMQQPNKDRAKM